MQGYFCETLISIHAESTRICKANKYPCWIYKVQGSVYESPQESSTRIARNLIRTIVIYKDI